MGMMHSSGFTSSQIICVALPMPDNQEFACSACSYTDLAQHLPVWELDQATLCFYAALTFGLVFCCLHIKACIANSCSVCCAGGLCGNDPLHALLQVCSHTGRAAQLAAAGPPAGGDASGSSLHRLLSGLLITHGGSVKSSVLLEQPNSLGHAAGRRTHKPLPGL